jgi:hypothetical protein
MKKLLLLFMLLLMNQVKSQEVPTALIDRVNSVKYIFEGKVLESNSYLSNNDQFIRTSHLVQITKILKGELECGTIEIITNGGGINDEELSISHSLELSPGSMGIFLCDNTNRPLSPIDFHSETNIEKLEGTFENQSFIHYWWDGHRINAADVWQNYDSLAQVYNVTEIITGLEFIECGEKLIEITPKTNFQHTEEEFPTYSQDAFDELINYANYKRENYTRTNTTRNNDEIFYDLSDIKITGTSQKYLEFDVTVKDNLGTKYLDQSAVRIEYDPAAFGNNVVANSNIIVTRGTLNADPNCYSPPIPSDANNNTILIPALETVYSQCKAPILQTAQSIMHIKMKIQTCNIPNDIALVDTVTFFDPSLIINYSAYAEFPADTFQTYYQELEHNKVDSVPACISFWPKKTAGGIGDTVTIKGNSFGINKGFILFPNADDGGTSNVTIEDDLISVWNDTLIKFAIPSAAHSYLNGPLELGIPAGTGQFTVISDSGSTILIDTLDVSFSVINHTVDYKPFVIAPWLSMSKKFTFRCDSLVSNYDSGKMKEVIEVALNDWKCLTGVDWELGSDIAYSDSIALEDTICTITFLDFPDSSNIAAWTHTRRARVNSPGTSYQIYEIDIEINSDYDWFSDTIITNSVPLGYQDFYSVILHELGHAHGLNHVIDKNAVMHYAQNPSSRLINLENDSSCDNGGNWVADYTNDSTNIHSSFFFERMEFDSITPCSSILAITEISTPETISIQLYPNPCDNIININSNDLNFDNLKYDIYDMSGKQVNGTKTLIGKSIDVSNLTKGFYVLRLQTRNNQLIMTSKFIKK